MLHRMLPIEFTHRREHMEPSHSEADDPESLLVAELSGHEGYLGQMGWPVLLYFYDAAIVGRWRPGQSVKSMAVIREIRRAGTKA